MTKKLFVIDAMAMAFRNFYAFGMRPLTTADGTPVSAVFGSAVFMNKLLNDHSPDYIVLCTDTKEPTFRHKMYDQYKANRDEMPADLAAQLDLFFKLFESLGIPVIRMPGFEADDIIGSITTQMASSDLDIYMVSGDKDFLQLVNENVFLFTPKKGGDTAVIDIKGVEHKFGVKPEQVIDFLAITGDASDNIPGVHGIGDKGAAKLIQTYGSLDGIYENVEKVTARRQRTGLEENKDKAYLSQELVTIKKDLELGFSLEDFSYDTPNALSSQCLLDFYESVEFKGLAKKVRESMSGNSEAQEPATQTEILNSRTNTSAKSKKTGAGTAPKDNPEEEPKLNPSNANYVLVDHASKLKTLTDALQQVKVFCFDTETTGLNIIYDKPIGASFSFESGKAFYVPFVEKHLGSLTPQEVITALKPILENSSITKVGHNVKFDIQMLANIGIDVQGPFADTMIEDHLLDATSKSHGLDSCCLRHLGYVKIPTSELIGKKAEIPMLDVPLEVLYHYACEDADLTLRLHNTLYPQLETENLLTVFHEVEAPLIPIIAKIEREGVFIDAGDLNTLGQKLEGMAAELTAEIYEISGCEFNIKSPKQLQEIMFEKLKVHELLGITKIKKTKTGYSTNEAVLSLLSEHPLPQAILKYRGITKLKNTYVDVLPTLINEKTNRIHTSFHQVGTTTGRLSSSDPNLQNIPIRSDLGKEIRKAFKTGSKNTVLLSADYSQVELRILAHIADEEVLIAAFKEGHDVHTATAAKVFNIDPKDVDATMRSRAKAINFGIIYGMGPKRLAAETGVTMKEASNFIKMYFAGYPKIKEFIESSKESARQTEMTYSLTGRRRPVPAINGSDRMALAGAENMAVNTPIQGSAADLIKLAMVKVDRVMTKQKLKSKMLLQVHDELVFEVQNDELAEMTKIIKENMETAMALKVPLRVDIGNGNNWLEAH